MALVPASASRESIRRSVSGTDRQPEPRRPRIVRRTEHLPATGRVLYRIEHFSTLPGVGLIVIGTVIGGILVGASLGFPSGWVAAFEVSVSAVTLAMVFAIQHTQGREQAATQRKLDELLRALPARGPVPHDAGGGTQRSASGRGGTAARREIVRGVAHLVLRSGFLLPLAGHGIEAQPCARPVHRHGRFRMDRKGAGTQRPGPARWTRERKVPWPQSAPSPLHWWCPNDHRVRRHGSGSDGGLHLDGRLSALRRHRRIP